MAADEASRGRFSTIEPEHFFIAMIGYAQAMDNIGWFGYLNRAPDDACKFLKKALGKGPEPKKVKVGHRSESLKAIFNQAEKHALEEKAPKCTLIHLFVAFARNPAPTIRAVLSDFGLAQGRAPLTGPAALIEKLRKLRGELLKKVVGQDHAVHCFVEGIFNSEVLSSADVNRRAPRGIFVFAGPPGVGKTFLAECGAEILGKPFKRFDMSGYAGESFSLDMLVGQPAGVVDAKPGQLTGFVEEHSDAILLFDEIEKASSAVIQLFLQVLDRGVLQDVYLEKDVGFKNTLIIFTTNAGRSLYDSPDIMGLGALNSLFHRKTVLNALEIENDPTTGKPYFPQAICSRMSTGYPVMFNRHTVKSLETIAGAELRRVGHLLGVQYGKRVEFEEEIPMCLVLREGRGTDARTMRSQAELFFKTEFFKFLNLYTPDHLQIVFERTRSITFSLDHDDGDVLGFGSRARRRRTPKVLVVTDPEIAAQWTGSMPEIEVRFASNALEAQSLLAAVDFDFALVDLYLGSERPNQSSQTLRGFDFVPPAATRVLKGQEALRTIHERMPDLPCYLLGLQRLDAEGRLTNSMNLVIDEELFLACVRSGGVRGIVATGFPAAQRYPTLDGLPELKSRLLEIADEVYRERKAAELASRGRVLAFDTAPQAFEDGEVVIRLRSLRLVPALAAEDISEVLHDIERPQVKFSDVYGAALAKEELSHIVEWLKDPGRFKAMGVRPPRGILLHGPSGTGKTMLARALAGETEATFIVESATNFLNEYAGGGPTNIRALFARARRYSPVVVFIDEIDGIGRNRTFERHSWHIHESLNALLTELDGFMTPSARPVIVIAATNLLDELDPALRRRFDREVEVERPDRSEREAFLVDRLQGSGLHAISDAVINDIAGRSTGVTIADLERVIQIAARTAAKGAGRIGDETLLEAFESLLFGDAKVSLDGETLLRVARHEAGHCVVAWRNGMRPVQVSIVSRGISAGNVSCEGTEDRLVHTRKQVESFIRMSLGGRAAEILYYGEEDGCSSGVQRDLETATWWARKMVQQYGMDEKTGLLALGPEACVEGPLALLVNKAMDRIIKTQMSRAIEELRSDRTVLDSLVEQLLRRNRLSREALEKIFGPS